MKFPKLSNVIKTREMTTAFAGYNHNLSCDEGEFYDTKNITVENFPALSPRHKRVKSKTFTNLLGICEKENPIWIDDGTLYINNVAKSLAEGVTISQSASMLPKNIVKMGAYICIFPDKIWYNTNDDTSGWIEASATVSSGTQIKFTVVSADFDSLSWKSESYYDSHTPNDGDYMMVTKDGKSSLRVYYGALKMWSSVATTYIKIQSTGIGTNFEEDDGIKITIDNSDASWTYAEKIFVNKEDDGRLSMNTYIAKKDTDYIIIPGILNANKTLTNLPTEIKRACPNMPYITECQNRLWGCSEDGHEVYCTKQGDPKNWNYYKGVSLDSWAATVGSDGVFTGAITYNQNPIFFKEDLMLKITVSASGAHSYREMTCPGVQDGSYRSLLQINSVLYYKAPRGVYAYDGSIPQLISENLGLPTYKDAVGGSVNYRYYLCMKDEDDATYLFVYDTKKGLWAKEDDTYTDYFIRHKEDLYMVNSNRLESVYGTALYDSGTDEGKIEWKVESGHIGFSLPDNKFIGRLNLRMSLEVGSYVDFWLEYDSDGNWVHIFNMSGKGTKTFTIPVIPRRCDHFRYKLSGKGDCKIYSVTKEIEEGSDGQ